MNAEEPVEKIRGDHSINISISYELKERMLRLATTYDQSLAMTIRQVLRVGIPVLEGMAKAQEELLRQYVASARRLREARGINDGARLD